MSTKIENRQAAAEKSSNSPTSKNLADGTTVHELSKKFWHEFAKNEALIYQYIISDGPDTDNMATIIVNRIKQDLGIQTCIGTYFKLGTRNCMNLPERQKDVEFILSPLFQKSNKLLLDAMYDEHLRHKLPKHWTIVKYKFYKPIYLEDFSVLAPMDDTVEITKDDFCYHPIVDQQKSQMSIMLFVADDKAQYIIKEEDVKSRTIWIPKNNIIHSLLDSAMGEYNLVNILDKIEINLVSDLEKKEFAQVSTYQMEKLLDDIDMIHNHSLSKIHKCGRCETYSYQIKLYVCKCKKVYYCDSVCQKAHRKLHLLGGCVE